MKKLLILVVSVSMALGSFASGPGEVDEKLIRSFRTVFPKASEVSWVELPEIYVVNFVEAGIRARIAYTKEGSMVHYIRYYMEQHLPFHVHFKIKEALPDRNIFGITEVSTISGRGNRLRVEYYIKLEDDDSWATVKMGNNGKLKVTENYRKLP